MESLLFDFAEEDNVKEVIGLLEKDNLDINAVDEDAYNLLMVAVFRSLKTLAFYLIENNINLSHQDSKGKTVLHHLALFYDKDILAKCLEKGADATLKDNYGNQSLWTAVFNDKGFGNERLDMIELLINSGADPNNVNNAGRSPLMLAKTADYANVVLKKLSI